MFVATALSVLHAGALYESDDPLAASSLGEGLTRLASGASFALPLLAILLCHELGHYAAARLHRVDASLPHFLPVPYLTLFGTMGAVIGMRGRIRSRAALMDIGASGPLAGMAVAVPVLLWALPRCEVKPASATGLLEGQSLLYLLLKRLTLGPIPEGHDVFLTAPALAGWAGLLVTAINLLPVGQLDGGHVAYALFGPAHDRVARWLHWGLLAAWLYNAALFVAPVVAERRWSGLGTALSNSSFWLVWFVVLGLLGGRTGHAHPPTEPGPLGRGRVAVGVFTLVLFVLLFMPTPMQVLG